MYLLVSGHGGLSDVGSMNDDHGFVAAMRDGARATVWCRCGWSVAAPIAAAFEAMDRHAAGAGVTVDLVQAESVDRAAVTTPGR